MGFAGHPRTSFVSTSLRYWAARRLLKARVVAIQQGADALMNLGACGEYRIGASNDGTAILFRAAGSGHQRQGRHIVTDDRVAQDLPFPPARPVRREIAGSGH